MAFWAHVALAIKHVSRDSHFLGVLLLARNHPLKQGEKWLARSDNLHGASFLGGRDEHMVRPLDGPAHGRIALPSCITQWRGSLQLINGSCLSRVLASPHRNVLASRHAHRTSALWETNPVPTRPLRLRPAVRRDLTTPVVTLPDPFPTSVHKITFDRLSTSRTFFSWFESVGCTPPCHAIHAHQMHPTRQTACPATVSVAYMCRQQGL